jgi:4-hydroxy-tetrahydrodipicolinate reductase
MIKVLISGASGKVGKEVVKAVAKEADMKLVAAVDITQVGADAGVNAGIAPLGVKISKDLKTAINDSRPDIAVDFTHPNLVMVNTRIILGSRVHAVIGTTGVSEDDLKEIEKLCATNKVNCLVAPNFAIGAVLMMLFSKTAAKYMPNVEIIEMHNDNKADSPSGTAIKTAELILQSEAENGIVKGKASQIEKIEGARGGNLHGIHIHSVRLPGLVAHQEVIFGGLGQTLTIRHDSLSRESFMPGVIMAVRKISNLKGLVYGLEHLLS